MSAPGSEMPRQAPEVRRAAAIPRQQGQAGARCQQAQRIACTVLEIAI
ncbi:hypothetical protein [Janthinobacterium sp. LM6]|nr:hypothetical protein [Janthinobacterium sp. LM6]